MDPRVVFEDEVLLVVDKPAGMIVNRAETTKGKVTLQDWLEENKQIEIERAGIVHRLDKETSGLLVVAKTETVMLALQKQFKDRIVQKTYWCLVHGKLTPKVGEVNAPINRNPFNRKRFGVFLGGREAKSEYEVLDYYHYKDEALSLVAVKPKTGRTHQIRVHLKHLGYPLVADEWYGGRKTSRNDRRWCPRLFLQAMSLSLIHPITGLKQQWKTELAVDLEGVLNNLSKD